MQFVRVIVDKFERIMDAIQTILYMLFLEPPTDDGPVQKLAFLPVEVVGLTF
jgi:hypothetical protein